MQVSTRRKIDINNIIDISKIEAGLMKLDMQELNVDEQIKYIYNFFKPEAEAKGLELSFDIPLSAKGTIVTTDCEKVYAILANLVKNAIKYTDNGKIWVESKEGKGSCFYFSIPGKAISQSQATSFDANPPLSARREPV